MGGDTASFKYATYTLMGCNDYRSMAHIRAHKAFTNIIHCDTVSTPDILLVLVEWISLEFHITLYIQQL